MKKFAIVYPYQPGQTEGRVVAVYEAEEESFTKYGGPWNDRSKSIHVEIPEDLKNKDIVELEGRLKDVQVGCKGVAVMENGEQKMEKIFDQNGDPVIGEDGHQLELPEYEEQPIYEQKFVICLKD